MTILPAAKRLAAHSSGPALGAIASLLLHGLALVLLVPDREQPREAAPEPKSIAVELVTAASFAALTRPAAPVPAVTVAPATPAADAIVDVSAPGAASVPRIGPEIIRATEFFAAAVLADRGSGRLRKAMQRLEGSERIVQLCGIEMIEQIHRTRQEFDPDVLVAYAMADTVMRDGVLVADGAAFRSQREWYGVRFACTAAADFSRVEALEFSIGEFIPHELWEAHNLTADEADD